MASSDPAGVNSGDEALLILQSMLCLLREKNILTRADVQELNRKVQLRTANLADGPLPCQRETAIAASQDMQRMTAYIGNRYGGKHARGLG